MNDEVVQNEQSETNVNDHIVRCVEILMKLNQHRYNATQRNIWWGVGMCVMMTYHPDPWVGLGHMVIGTSAMILGFVLYRDRK